MLVQLDSDAGHDEVLAVEAVFRRYGFDAEVEATWHKRPQTGNGLAWMIAVAIGFGFSRFFGGFLEAAGADAWSTLKGWVSDLQATRSRSVHGSEGNVHLTDADGNELVLWRLPDEAFKQLFEIDWSTRQPGILWWDEERAAWTGTADLTASERADIDPWTWDHERREWVRTSERS